MSTQIEPSAANVQALQEQIDLLTDQLVELSLREKNTLADLNRYHLLFKQAPFAFFLIEAATGTIIECNSAACYLFGVGENGLKECNIMELYVDSHSGKGKAEVLFEKLAVGDVVGEELKYRRMDGTWFWGDFKVNLVYDEQGIITHIRLAVTNVTNRILEDQERKEKNAELLEEKAARESQDRRQKLFFDSIRHDMMHPIMAITGLSDILAESDLPEDSIGHVRTMREASHLLTAFVDDLFDWSSIESNLFKLQSSSFNLREAVCGTVEFFRYKAENKGIKLTCEHNSDLPLNVVGDKKRLQQIVTNLVSNAIKFTANGSVMVKIFHESGGKFQISVEDTGMGISIEKQSCIFDPYVQAEECIADKFGGSGLGLATCKQIVEKMGGKIVVSSNLGKGSKFHFTIQLKLQTDLEVRSSIKCQANTAILNKLRVLVADDTQEITMVVPLLLRRDVSSVETVSDGQQAFDAIKNQGENPFGLLLIDCQMPVMDGYTAVKEIRAHESKNNWKPMLIIMMTAQEPKEAEKKAKDVGCDAYLQKPIKKEALLQIIPFLINCSELFEYPAVTG